MTEKVMLGNAELWHGDCTEVLPLLTGVDAVITDPPYEIEAHMSQRRVTRRPSSNATGERRALEYMPLDFSAITEDLRRHVSMECVRLTEGWILVFCQAEAVSLWRDSIERAGGKYKRAMVWVKPDGLPQMSGDRPGMGYESIVAAWAGQGRSAWNGGGRKGVFTYSKGAGNKGKNPHPTTKPEPLMRELIALFSNETEVVLDPFMGGGTTGVACHQLNRRFIGIERERRYFDLACERVLRAQSQLMFSSHPPKKSGAAQMRWPMMEA